MSTPGSSSTPGSTDGTQEIIREALAELPGGLHESPWKGFDLSRTEAIGLARERADYLLFIDARQASRAAAAKLAARAAQRCRVEQSGTDRDLGDLGDLGDLEAGDLGPCPVAWGRTRDARP
ncbi:hypothetical protein ACF1A5_13125 [Streptomyces sp. NPDC014864]|uniref:hypothetical protein n=1 Tax=Streptomyces sp. NPDC014864 TaxID=3364924 RepID=UPI003701AE75